MEFKTVQDKITALELSKEHGSITKLNEQLLTELKQLLQLHKTSVSGSALPVGFKIYECTDCKEINVKKDNREIRVGFCDNCDHPLWNDDVN